MAEARLHHHIVGDEAGKWLYFLHGIYGAGRNWATFARALVEARPDWGAVLVDLRLHGRSPDFDPPHTLAACARDLARLAAALDRPAAGVLGHSFGGKVALLAAAPLSARQLWLVDSTPSPRTPGGSAHRMLGILRRHAGPFEDRRAAVAALEAEGFAPHVAGWMATNLVSGPAGYVWRFDLDAISALLDDFFRSDLWEIVEEPPSGTEIHLVRATGSDVLAAAELERIASADASGRTFGHELPGGHWLHVDNPDGLLELVAPRLP